MSQLKQSGKGRSLFVSGGSGFLFYPSLQLIGWGPSKLRRPICFTTILISSENIFTETLQMMFYQISGHSITQLSWLIKLIITSTSLVNLPPICISLNYTFNLQISAITRSQFHPPWYNYPAYGWECTKTLPQKMR